MPEVKHIILYAEDDLDDLFIVRQAFQAYDETIEVVHAPNGFAALDYLDKHHGESPSPCLIILDINMPGLDGRETLIKIKQSPKFAHIPVVLFTTSSSQRDKEFAIEWKADFVTKPLMFDELEALARTFVDKCNFEITKRA